MRIFLSYANEDRHIAEPIYLALTGAESIVFFDRTSLSPGQEYHNRITSEVQQSDLFIFLVTPHSLAPGSYTLTELGHAAKKWTHPQGRVLPVLCSTIDLQSIPHYLKAVTLLEPKGNIAAETAACVAELRAKLVHPAPTFPHSNASTTALPEPRINVFSDSSEAAFVDHLAQHDTIWIMGITNEHLTEYMRRAKEQRRRGWKEVRIVFQAQHLVDHFGEGNQTEKWERGVKSIVEFLLHEGESKARKLDIRHANRILPFVGQYYDHSHIRVAFILPVRDIRRSSYLNYQLAAENQQALPLSTAGIEGHNLRQFIDLKFAFENVRNGSTPILTANVIGRHRAGGPFIFKSLIPQNNWRHYRSVIDDRPAHLVTFVLMHNGEQALLQFRNHNNSNGQLETFGVIPGKVNDEDFLSEPPERDYWNRIYRMQAAFDDLNRLDQRAVRPDPETVREANDTCILATESFSRTTGTKIDEAIPPERLSRVCRNAAIRSLDDKLGLEIDSTRLVHIGKRAYSVFKQEYSLYIQLFGLKITTVELDSIPGRRPFADIHPFSADKLRKFSRDQKLTMFLQQNLGAIERFLKNGGVDER